MKGDADEEATGLPGIRTWRGMYVLVLAVLGAWVALLAALTRAFP